MTIKLTKTDFNLIREAAKVACRKEGQTLKRIEVGVRFGLTEGYTEPSINILQVDSTENWEESDLYTLIDWAEFKKGIPSEDGRAVVDFYLGDKEGLCTNMQAHFNDSRLVWVGIEGPWGFTYWGTPMEYGKVSQ